MFRLRNLAIVLVFICLPSQAAEDNTHAYRTWKDSTGNYTVEAALVKRVGDQIHLRRKDNGKVITISSNRLSSKDQTYVKEALSKSSDSDESDEDKSNEKEQLYKVNDKISFTGNWNNRKYGTSGVLNCAAVVKDEKSWTAKFDGNGVYGKFSYDVVISTKDNSKQIQLQGTSTVSGHTYKWNGTVKNGILFGKYTATNGNNGTFRLKQVTND